MLPEWVLQALPSLRAPSVTMLAQLELEEAQRSLLAAQSGYEYAKRVADYHQDRIDRLTQFLKAQANKGAL